jgi:HEAT repeat protein
MVGMDLAGVRRLARVFVTAPDRRTRHLAGQALARSAPSARSVREAGLYMYTSVDVRRLRATAWVPGRIGDRSAVSTLVAQARHRDELVRARVAAALGRIGDPEAADALRAALDDLAPRVRANAATALGAIAVPLAGKWLEPCLQDPHPDVRAAGAAALRRHDPRTGH